MGNDLEIGETQNGTQIGNYSVASGSRGTSLLSRALFVWFTGCCDWVGLGGLRVFAMGGGWMLMGRKNVLVQDHGVRS